MSTEVRIEGISKSYTKGKPVLNPIHLTIQPGELFFLLGSSGCGKSTLLRIIAGLLEADAGKLYFNGKDVTGLAPEKRRAAMVFQNYALWPHMTVFENIAFGLRVQHAKNTLIRDRVMHLLELVRLADCADRKIQSLSGGQQQRIALARALAVDPAVLLLDEPLSNLDACLRDEMRLEIRRICKENKLTAIYVTHDRKEALSMADRIAVIHKGNLIQTASPREIYEHPVDAFTAGFLGDANIISGTVDSIENKIATVNTECGLLRIPADELKKGNPVTLMIRPENLHFDQRDGDNELRAMLTDGTYLGERSEWRFCSGKQSLVMFETASSEHKPEAHSLYVSPEKIVRLSGENK